MKAELVEKVISPAVPAVTEERVILDLSVHEARVLRTLHGKLGAAPNAFVRETQFLSALNRLFPEDFTDKEFAGISAYSVRFYEEYCEE